MSCAAMYGGADDGAMPAKVLEKTRPTVMAGFAKLVELVKKYAAAMYAPTAAGAAAPRRVRVSEKITRIRPSVAMTSAKSCAPVARCLVEIDTKAFSNIAFATIAPVMQPAICAGA